jgi:hypothetical protein
MLSVEFHFDGKVWIRTSIYTNLTGAGSTIFTLIGQAKIRCDFGCPYQNSLGPGAIKPTIGGASRPYQRTLGAGGNTG